MRILRLSLIIIPFLFTAPSADAQSPYKGGMNHMVLRTAPIKNIPAPSPRNIAAIEPAAGEGKKTDAQMPEVTLEDRVWAKYVSLAGRPQPVSGMASASAPGTTAKQQSLSGNAAAKAAPPAGIAGLLQQYQERKASRAQLRSLGDNE